VYNAPGEINGCQAPYLSIRVQPSVQEGIHGGIVLGRGSGVGAVVGAGK
jgi:hypothetical protein